jgi:hypothetical protein
MEPPASGRDGGSDADRTLRGASAEPAMKSKRAESA